MSIEEVQVGDRVRIRPAAMAGTKFSTTPVAPRAPSQHPLAGTIVTCAEEEEVPLSASEDFDAITRGHVRAMRGNGGSRRAVRVVSGSYTNRVHVLHCR